MLQEITQLVVLIVGITFGFVVAFLKCKNEDKNNNKEK